MLKKSIARSGRERLIFNRNIRALRLIYFILILSLLFVMISCQKKSQVTIHLGPSSDESGVVEYKIEDGKYQTVLEKYKSMLKQVHEDSKEAADIYNNMGGIYAEYEKDQTKAEYYLNRAINIHEDKGDEIGLAGDYTEMSKIYICIGGEIEEGLNYLEQAEEIYLKFGMEDVLGLAGVMTNKGHLLKEDKRYEDALEAYKKAEEIYKIRQKEDATIHVFIGQTYLKMQEYKLSEEQYLEAIRINKKNDNKYQIAKVQFQLGWLYVYTGDFDNALEQYNKALSFFKTDNYYFLSAGASYNNMSLIYEKIGDIDKALETSINAYKIVKKIKPVTSEVEEKIGYSKEKIKRYYQNIYNNATKDEFEKWFQENVIDK